MQSVAKFQNCVLSDNGDVSNQTKQRSGFWKDFNSNSQNTFGFVNLSLQN